MPQSMTSLIGTTARKVHNGKVYRLTIVSESRFEVYNETDSANVGAYSSMTAAAQAIRGEGAVNGWSFWGLTNPNARSINRRSASGMATDESGIKITGKCRHEGCYEPADCKHGFCKDHCQRHSIGSYSDRKYPRSTDPHIGVEIEVVYPDADTFRRGVGIDCHRDGSLGQYGAEYKVMAKSSQIAAEAAELVEQLWKRRARVNRGCGLHVHIDVRQVGSEKIEALFAWANATQECWFALMPPSRRSSSYCRRLNGPIPAHEHFAWIHTTTYNTVEVRLHGGTLNPYKMAGWLTALVHLQAKLNDAAFAFPATCDAEADFWAVFADCPQAGKEYLATRKANGGVLRDAAFGHIEE
ncbi:MAG: amidoligase family protein [Patescibacteria group bacterium]|nr:amidoligase family protein [Patescibacteria group bacterium]